MNEERFKIFINTKGQPFDLNYWQIENCEQRVAVQFGDRSVSLAFNEDGTVAAEVWSVDEESGEIIAPINSVDIDLKKEEI
jgi:hypothetical protein